MTFDQGVCVLLAFSLEAMLREGRDDQGSYYTRRIQ